MTGATGRKCKMKVDVWPSIIIYITSRRHEGHAFHSKEDYDRFQKNCPHPKITTWDCLDGAVLIECDRCRKIFERDYFKTFINFCLMRAQVRCLMEVRQNDKILC